MIKNLVIVESPAKARTIEKFLGKDYTVKSCYGHVRDLAEDKLSVDVGKNYRPHYYIPPDKKKLVSELKKMAKEAEQIWLATDEDREGEAISWHLVKALNLNEEKTNRIVFHEITKNAIEHAIRQPREIDKNLVDAQQARRILDRLVGFELSPVLWKKIKPALSAGRVQSVAVRLIVEKEREITRFKPQNFFRVTAEFLPLKDGKSTGKVLKAELPHKFTGYEDAEAFLKACRSAQYHVAGIEKKPSKRKPAPPFTTSTLQQEASRKLGFSVSRTMTLAQKLYESGYITYMRTDSVNLSQEAIKKAGSEIGQRYGKKYAQSRQYTTKSQGAQEAHEAIRPTDLSRKEVTGNHESRLYELIWKRTIASQMADAQLEKTQVRIRVTPGEGNDFNFSQNNMHFNAGGEVVKFDGFLKVYIESSDEEEEEKKESTLLPPLEKGQQLAIEVMQAIERFNRPPARYTEASLVKKLEELGIGRPSTYAPTISTIQKRGYAEKSYREGKQRSYRLLTLKDGNISPEKKTEVYGKEKGKLFPSNMGIVVNDFLMDHFENVMNYNFTATVENEFDHIASGRENWQKMIDNFYRRFHPTVEEAEKIRQKVTGERYIGEEPETGRKLYAKVGKYGPYIQKGEGGGPDKPEFARLKDGQLIETISLEEALALFKLPRELGEYEGKPVVASIGKFGPYVRHDSRFYSIPKDKDPYTIELEAAKEIIEYKRKAQEKKNINTFEHQGEEVRVLRGPYGPYISFKKKNFKIPKDKKADQLTREEAIEIIQDPSNQSKGRRRRKKGYRKKK